MANKTNGKKIMRNIRVCARNDRDNPGFNVFLAISGKEEYVMHHRHNGLLFAIIKDGIRLDELKRINVRNSGEYGRREDIRRRITRTDRSLRQLIKVIDEFVTDYRTDWEAA